MSDIFSMFQDIFNQPLPQKKSNNADNAEFNVLSMVVVCECGTCLNLKRDGDKLFKCPKCKKILNIDWER